jgi:hypothetical protein
MNSDLKESLRTIIVVCAINIMSYTRCIFVKGILQGLPAQTKNIWNDSIAPQTER